MKRFVQILIMLAVVLVAAAYFSVRASLPELEGRLTGEGLINSVAIERDELGVPTVRGENRLDVAWATGFLHGVDSVGYRLVREYRLIVREFVLSSLILGCGEIDEPIQLRKQFQTEGPLWRVVTERPAHLIPAGHVSWEEMFKKAATLAIDRCEHGQIETCTWGARNHVRITHPLAQSLPFLATWLDVNDSPLPGGDYTPRLQQGTHAASERFAVSPGDEANGYFHMPGGQSGHPLSPFYRAGHQAWVRGERLPFLPGASEFRLVIEPSG